MRLIALPAFQDNYIWMLVDADGDALVVDPGDAAPVLEAVADGISLIGVLITHHHPDHCAGLAALRERWPQLPVFGPADERIPQSLQVVAEGDQLRLKNWSFRVIEVPGHTRSHIAYHGGVAEDEPLLFCGDTLFSLGCGRMFEGSAPQMLASLDRLAALPGDSRVCCGHEYTLANAAFALAVDPSNDALRRRYLEAQNMRQSGQPSLPSPLHMELACNPFLRVDSPAVRGAVATRLGRAAQDRCEVFAELRRWKDGFAA